MADQLQTAHRHTDNSRECSCSPANLNNQLSTLKLSDSKDSLRDADVFRLGEEAKRFFASFATDAALLHAAEGNTQVSDEPAIYPHRAGVDSLGDAMGAAQVLRPDARREAVFDVIGVIDHFFFGVEWSDRYNRTENFFTICAA